jgi:hypothetical protein
VGGSWARICARKRPAKQLGRLPAPLIEPSRRAPWSVRMEGYSGPAQPSPTVGQCLNGGYGWLEIECCRCKTRASLPLDAIRRARAGLEARAVLPMPVLRHAPPPVRTIKLTEQREITAYKWVAS